MSSTTRILIVDDEPANRRLLSAILTPTFGTTVHAADGQEALAILAREPIDLVVLDVMMPGPDGVAVCTTIRSNPATAFVPIILVTALADAASRARGKAAGADDFLTKPVHEDELLARATNLLRMRRYHAQVEAQREDAAREARKWQLASSVAGAVATCRNYADLMLQLDGAIGSQLGIDTAGVFIADGSTLALKAAHGAAVEQLAGATWPWDGPRWLARAAGASIIRIARATAPSQPIRDLMERLAIADAVVVPIAGAGELHGLFILARQTAFAPDEVVTLDALAPHISNAVNNVRLHLHAEQLLRSRTQLTELIVHDLRGPLASVLLNLQFTLTTDDPVERHESVADAQQATERLMALVNDLLDTSAAEEGRLRVSKVATDVEALIGTVCRRATSASSSHKLALALAPGTAVIDPKLIQRVIENIFGNATQYVSFGGTIAVGMHVDAVAIVITIANDGPALSAEARAGLFQKYASDTLRNRSRGLGLYFCRLVVEAHGGQLREIEPAVGVCFEIRLPVEASTSI